MGNDQKGPKLPKLDLPKDIIGKLPVKNLKIPASLPKNLPIKAKLPQLPKNVPKFDLKKLPVPNAIGEKVKLPTINLKNIRIQKDVKINTPNVKQLEDLLKLPKGIKLDKLPKGIDLSKLKSELGEYVRIDKERGVLIIDDKKIKAKLQELTKKFKKGSNK